MPEPRSGSRLLRLPVPARRRPGRPGRPQGGPGVGCAPRARRLRRGGGRRTAGRRRAGRRPARDGGVAGARRRVSSATAAMSSPPRCARPCDESPAQPAGPGRAEPAARGDPPSTPGSESRSGRRRRPGHQHVTARGAPAQPQRGLAGAGAARCRSSSLRARPEPDDRSSSASTPACTPIVNPPDPVVRSIRPARASATRHVAGPRAHADVRAHLADDHVAAAGLDVGRSGHRTDPDRSRAGPDAGPPAHGAEHDVARAGGHLGITVDVGLRRLPAPVRTVARPARPVTPTSPAPVRAVDAGAGGCPVTVTTSGTTRSGRSFVDRTVNVGASPPAPGADQLISAARTASAPADAGPSSVSGAAPTEPSHDATSPMRCAQPPAAAGSCRTSTRTSCSPGALPSAASALSPPQRRPLRPGAPRPGRRPPRRPGPPGPPPSGSPARTSIVHVRHPSTQPRRCRPSSGPPGRWFSRSLRSVPGPAPVAAEDRGGHPSCRAGAGRTAHPAPPAPPRRSATPPGPRPPARPGS